MRIRADILKQLADVLAELYYDEGSIQAMVITAGLKPQQIPMYSRAKDTWVFILEEAEIQGNTQAILNHARSEKPVYERLRLVSQTYTDWVTAGRPPSLPGYTLPGILRAPPPPGTFAGRTVELQKLTQVLLRNQVAAISAAVPGMGGIGKTTLALKLASDLAPHFPGGVVWLEAGDGAGQSALVDRLARKLNIDLVSEPLVEKRAAILQSVLANRGRVFVILDDLWNIDLGRWAGKVLLPADRVLLVTGRDLALCHALCQYVQRLDVLPEAEAMQLLANRLGDLGQHEVEAREVAKLLDDHPLALNIAAGRCLNGAADLPWLLRRLRTGPTLGELKLPGQESRESSVEASLAISYGDLNPDLQQRFRALGVFALAPFDLAGLAAVWKVESVDEAEEMARPLVQWSLLAQESVGDGAVYRQHTLLRAYAKALLAQAGELDAVAARHVAYYQALPGRQAENWQVAEAFWEQIEEAWWRAQRDGPAVALPFYYAASFFLYRRARHAAHIEWTSALLKLPATQISDENRAMLLTDMGSVYSDLGEKPRALELYEQALPLRRQVGDKAGEATTLTNIGRVYDDLGEKPRALELYEQALPLRRQVDDKAGEATTLTNMGSVYSDLGEKPRALELYEQTLPLWRQVGDEAGEAATLTKMGIVCSALGEKPRAVELYEQALPLWRQVGDKAGEAQTLTKMGNACSTLGKKPQALELYEQALPLFRQVWDKIGEASTLTDMGSVYSDLGEKPRALELYEQALLLRRQVGDKAGEAATLTKMGNVCSALGEKPRAVELYKQALLLQRQAGNKAGEAAVLTNMGNVYSALGEKPRAVELYEQALPLWRQAGNKAGEAAVLTNMGNVYSSLGEKPRAVELYKQALPLWRQAGNKAGEAAVLTNMGNVYFALGEKPRALELYEQALPLRRQMGKKAGEAAILTNMGNVYSALGEKSRALELYEQALPLLHQVGKKAGEAAILTNMGNVYFALGKKQRALELYGQALPLRRQVGDLRGERTTRRNIAMVYNSLDRLGDTEAQLLAVVALDEAIGYPDLERDRAALEKVRAARRAQTLTESQLHKWQRVVKSWFSS